MTQDVVYLTWNMKNAPCALEMKVYSSAFVWNVLKISIRSMSSNVSVETCVSSSSERDTCTPMFITALFIIARTWKQPRCPSAEEWIRKLWYIYTMEYYSAIKKNSFELVLMRWMKLEPII